jgi:hypothetical protein
MRRAVKASSGSRITDVSVIVPVVLCVVVPREIA